AKIERAQEFPQGFLLGKRRRIMNTENQGLSARFQCFRGSDVRLDHELFDELVCIKPFRNDYLVYLAVWRKQDFLFRQVEFQWLTRVTPPLQHGIGVP